MLAPPSVVSNVTGLWTVPLCDPGVLQLRHLTRPEHLPAGLSDHGPVVYAEPVGHGEQETVFDGQEMSRSSVREQLSHRV